jgi:hypothetical protein
VVVIVAVVVVLSGLSRRRSLQRRCSRPRRPPPSSSLFLSCWLRRGRSDGRRRRRRRRRPTRPHPDLPKHGLQRDVQHRLNLLLPAHHAPGELAFEHCELLPHLARTSLRASREKGRHGVKRCPDLSLFLFAPSVESQVKPRPLVREAPASKVSGLATSGRVEVGWFRNALS